MIYEITKMSILFQSICEMEQEFDSLLWILRMKVYSDLWHIPVGPVSWLLPGVGPLGEN